MIIRKLEKIIFFFYFLNIFVAVRANTAFNLIGTVKDLTAYAIKPAVLFLVNIFFFALQP